MVRNNFKWIALTLASTMAWAGGVSGGGGGTVPAELATPDAVHSAIRQSRFELYLLFNKLTHELYTEPSAWQQKSLFSEPKTIFNLLKDVKIEERSDGPCIDGNGNEVDGAAPGSTPDSICISVSRLSAKLTDENLRSQTTGLLAHELSHLLGANEDQAVELQRWVLKKIRGTGTDQALTLAESENEYLYLSYLRAGNLTMYLQAHPLTPGAPSPGNRDEACGQAKALQEAYNHLLHSSVQERYAFLSRSQFTRYQQTWNKIDAVKYSICNYNGQPPQKSFDAIIEALGSLYTDAHIPLEFLGL